jgi:hypothetical protein
LTYALTGEGWDSEQAFPAISEILSLAAPAAQPGTLLIWAKDKADLQIAHWDSGRLSYPQPWLQSAEIEDRKILALNTAGPTTWWVQKVQNDLHLYRWVFGQEKPALTKFEKVGSKADQVAWVGGERLLVKETHARDLTLVSADGGKTVAIRPTHLKKADLSEFKLVPVMEELRLARFTDDVVQWLGDDLQSLDQIMLPDGGALADFVAIDDASGWALEKDSAHIHRLEFDDRGIAQVAQTIEIPGGQALARDPVIGLVLLGQNSAQLLGEGRPNELQLVDSIDHRAAHAGGIKETKCHRIGLADVDGDGTQELLLLDDLRHRISVVGHADGKLAPQLSWPVFDDKVYPYNEESGELVREPRAVIGADVDGDDRQDLAMICHDRLIIYLAHEQE